MSSPTSNHNPLITPDLDVEQIKLQDVLRKEPTAENSETFRSLSSPYNQQTASDTTSPPPFAEIPQWKKDLIQRRKTNIAKTIAANQSLPINANSSKATTPSFGAISPNFDVKNSPTAANNNKCDKSMICASKANTTRDVKSTPSQHSSASALNLNNMGKMPATLPHHHHQQQQQQQVEIESCGGHYTQVNNKSSGGSHKYNEKLASPTAVRTSASILQPEQQAPVPVSRSFAIVEQNSNDGGSPSLAQENVKFRKNPTEHHETTNTTSSDSLLTSTSRLSSSLKVAAAAEIYKKSNKEHLSVCVGETTQQQAHTLQEPALTTNVKSNSNNNGNSGGTGTGTASDDEQLLHRRQLKSEQESDSLSSSCAAASVNVTSPKEGDFKVFPINNSVNGSLSPKVLNKKPCGIASASVRSSPTAAITTSSAQSQFVKNQTNSNLVSSHHNYKINTKYRSSQNTTSASAGSGVESPTTVTNNKKKMVAVQEMNEITNNELDFDPSEELQYGPGIVSKLRCRYLSLALRQSGKQRLSMDTMRRATSLNNLLDDNDVHDEDDEEDDTMENTNKESNSPTMVFTPQENAAKTNEPIAGGFKKNAKNHSGDKISGTTLASYNNHQHRSRHIKRGNDSLKRARSVEALLCEKSPWNFCNSQPTMMGNCATDSVTIEDKINNARDRLLSGTDSTPKRLTSIIDDTERPPPDLVKQTLKIFEASANRRGRVNSRSSGGEVANKVANYRTIITQNKPAVTFPKPPVSPKKSNLKKTTTTTTTSAEVKKAPASTPPTTPTSSSSLLLQAEKNLVGLSSTPAANSRTTAAFRQKMDFTPIRSIGCVEGLSENSPDIIPRHKLLDKTVPTNIAVDSPVTELTKKIEKLRIESPAPATQTQQPPRKELQSKFSAESSDRDSEDDDEDDDDSIDGEYVVNIDECNSSTKPISKSALENIAKAGTSQQFQFQSNSSTTAATVLSNGSSGGKYSEALHDIPTLTITGGGNTVKQIGVIRPLLAEPQYSEKNSTIGCIEENTSSAQSTPSLTSREIEKNRINNEKKIEKLGSNNSMDELGCVGFAKVNKNIVSAASTSENDDAVAQAPAWSSAIINKKKRNPAAALPENNTMVFNFKDRKEVPDYIENDGLIFKRKRELPKPNESGFVLLGDLSLETSTDPEDDWPMCPPSPCDVEFENANILIDGKSSIKNKPKDPHFRVQFNDTLTSTFEYPSESSVIEDSGSEYADHSLNSIEVSSLPNPSHETDAPIVHHHVTVDEIIQLPHNNKVLGNLSLGSAPLGSYTPVKAKIENIFQLGVTRVPNSQSDKSDDEVQTKEKLPADYYGDLDDPSLEYLKPASDDLTIAYSEGSLKTDLLY